MTMKCGRFAKNCGAGKDTAKPAPYHVPEKPEYSGPKGTVEDVKLHTMDSFGVGGKTAGPGNNATLKGAN